MVVFFSVSWIANFCSFWCEYVLCILYLTFKCLYACSFNICLDLWQRFQVEARPEKSYGDPQCHQGPPVWHLRLCHSAQESAESASSHTYRGHVQMPRAWLFLWGHQAAEPQVPHGHPHAGEGASMWSKCLCLRWQHYSRCLFVL